MRLCTDRMCKLLLRDLRCAVVSSGCVVGLDFESVSSAAGDAVSLNSSVASGVSGCAASGDSDLSFFSSSDAIGNDDCGVEVSPASIGVCDDPDDPVGVEVDPEHASVFVAIVGSLAGS